MAIEFACDECGASLKVPDAKAGARGKCPKCRASIVVPDAEAEWEEEDPWEAELPAAEAPTMPPRVARDSSGRSGGRGASGRGAYRSKTGLVWAITVLMAGYLVTTLATGAAQAYQLSLFNRLKAGQEVSEETLIGSDALVALPAAANVLSYLVLAVLWCVWTAGANRNARAISGRDLEYTPGWSVGCYFVPFANLVWPYNAMKEIWENSKPSASTGLVGTWWGLWIFNNVVGQIEFRLGQSIETVDEAITATHVAMVGVPVALASGGVALALVWKLHTMQEAAVSRRADA